MTPRVAVPLCLACLMLSSVSFAAKDVLTHAVPGSVRIDGRLGAKLDLCVSNRLLVQDIEAVVKPYRVKTEIGGGDWRCEYWGKWYTSLTLADAYHSTPATRAKRDEAVKALMVTAAQDGYLGTREPEHRMKGWDVWGCKYALLGLMAYYDRTHDATALKAASRHTDVLISEMGPGKNNIEDVGEWNGLPASSVLEPVVLLYERSGNKKYLDFAEYIVSCWNKPSSRLPNGMKLVDDALAGKKPAEMCAPKAYEMMSCFEGLCELYRVTGNRKYLDASIKIADGIVREESTIIGVGTHNEIWYGGASDQTGLVEKPMETCVTVTWMKLCDQLLRLTGDPRYADELEKNLYNGLLSAMMPDGKWWAYFDGLMGFRVPSYVQHADVQLSCCVVNGPRALMITPFWAFMQNAEGPVVNLYAPGSAQIGAVKLMVTGDYPVSDRAAITITPAQPKQFTLSLRIPAWSNHTVVRVNGQAQAVTPGYTRIRRTWEKGDRVEVIFDMHGRFIERNGQYALLRGPIVMALDNRLTPSSARQSTLDINQPIKPNPAAAKKISAWMAFDVGPFTFCDYASAGNGFSQNNLFRTWLPQPVDLAAVYHTGYTIPLLSHSPTWTNPPLPLPRVQSTMTDLALTVNGAHASSDSEYSQEPGCTSQLIDGIIASPADFTNRWHSSVDKPHPHWVEVRLAKPAKISSVVLHFGDPSGYPVSFEGISLLNGQQHKLFNEQNNKESSTYKANFDPVMADSFRLLIYSSASVRFPNAAQISEIEIHP